MPSRLAAVLLAAACLCAGANPAFAASTDVAAVKLDKEGKPHAGFIARHESFLKRGKEGPIDVLFIGDSITQGWEGQGKSVWKERYEPLKAANFGIGGDRTEHVLWRIANGELDGIAPKVVVLMLGTNNHGSPAADILKGDAKVIEQIRAKLPAAKLLILAIFPRGADHKNPDRAKLAEVNQGLAKFDDGKQVRYLDIGAKFLDAEGNLPKDVMPDALHPNAKGYAIWADAMDPLLKEMLGATP